MTVGATCPTCGLHVGNTIEVLERHAGIAGHLNNRQLEWVFHPSSRSLVRQQYGYDGEDVPVEWRHGLD